MSTGEYIAVLNFLIDERQVNFDERLQEKVEATQKQVERNKNNGQPTKDIYRYFLSDMSNAYSAIISFGIGNMETKEPFSIAMKALGQME